MTRKHFELAAAHVRAILAGTVSDVLPAWADELRARGLHEDQSLTDISGIDACNYLRAVWIAEAYIALAVSTNPRFNKVRFLRACGFSR